MRKFMFGSKRRAIVTALLALIVLPGSAFAAWTIFTGATGTAQGRFQTVTPSTAVTLASDGPDAFLCYVNGAAGTCNVAAKATNNTAVARVITGGTGTITSSPSECASHLSIAPSGLSVNVPASASNLTITLTGLVSVDGTLPATCSNGTFTLSNLALNTTP